VSKSATASPHYRELGIEGYVPLAMDKSHGRIIWDCAWAHEGDVFATASRDKTASSHSSRRIDSSSSVQVKVWKSNDASGRKWTALATIAIKETSATAIAFSRFDGHDWYETFMILGQSGVLIGAVEGWL
jgi:hypothetical protein